MFEENPSFTDQVYDTAVKALDYSCHVTKINKELLDRIATLEQEAAKIVHCGECGYYYDKGGFCIGLPTEPMIMRRPDDFCSRGCRRSK